MKQFSILILIYFISFNKTFSQIEFSTKIGLSSLQNLGLEISTPISENKYINTSIDYRYQSFYTESSGFINSNLVSSFENNGFTIRLGIKRKFQKMRKSKLQNLGLTSSVFYRRLEGIKDIRNFILFGRNENYKLKYLYHDLGFSILREKMLHNNIISYYYSFGFGIRRESNLRLDDFTSENETKPLFLFDIGIRFNLFSINSF